MSISDCVTNPPNIVGGNVIVTKKSDACKSDEACINLPGSYKCTKCDSGFELKNGKCVDIDECIGTGGTTLSPCPTGNTCVNLPGTFYCAARTTTTTATTLTPTACPSGYELVMQKSQSCIEFTISHIDTNGGHIGFVAFDKAGQILKTFLPQFHDTTTETCFHGKVTSLKFKGGVSALCRSVKNPIFY